MWANSAHTVAQDGPQRLSAAGNGEFELPEVAGFIGDIARCYSGAMV
jgi:hypothetical protein